MANNFYDTFKQALGAGSINLSTDGLRVHLLNSSYAVNLATHTFVSDLPGANVIISQDVPAGRTYTGGVLDLPDMTFNAITGGVTVAYIVLSKWTGTATTSQLISYYDTIGGLPYGVPSGGGNLQIIWDNGANRVLKIG